MLEICMIIVETADKPVGVSFFKWILTWCKYFLHSLQGQLDGVHFLIFNLKSPSGSDCFISSGIKFQIFGPKWDIVSVPL